MSKIEIPNHVAIVMDGNGRWAKKRGLPRTAGHEAGEAALLMLLKALLNMALKRSAHTHLAPRTGVVPLKKLNS